MHASSAFAQQVALTLVGTLLLTLGMVFDGPSASDLVATKSLAPAESLAPTYPWTVWTEDHCVRPGIPDRATYTSLEEMVKDTIPGEWWSRTNPAYVVPLNHGALKSAAIIIRTRISYHIYNPVPTYFPNTPNNPTDYVYNTTNLAIGEAPLPNCDSAAMNTILPGRPSLPGGGSDYGNGSEDPLYQSNQAAQDTAGRVIINEQASVIATEWQEENVEKRVAICNHQSRDWGYCALNALATLLPGPGYGQNKRARRLSTTPAGRVEFKVQAYDERTARTGRSWELFGSGYMQVLPNTNLNSYGGNQGYQYYSPDMTFMVPFPQSGTFYICVYGQGGTIDDDSLHVGIDDNGDGVADALTGLDMMSTWHLGSWQWVNRVNSGGYASVQVSGDPSNAFHRVRIWMREDGIKVEKVILSTSTSCPP